MAAHPSTTEMHSPRAPRATLALTGVMLLMSATAATLHATEGINLIGVGPVQQGTAGAGVASAKNSTWLILNPAGLTDIERGVDASFQYFGPNRSIDSTVSGGAGRQEDDSEFYIPSLSASFGCCRGDSGFLGVGLYGTSGMGVEYDYGRIGPPGGQSMVDRKTELSIIKMTLTYAQKFNHGFSVGAGPVMVLSRLRTDMFNQAGVPSSGSWDTAQGAGLIVGANQTLGDRLTVGASYISEQFLTDFNEYDGLLSDSMNLPQQLTVGLAYVILANLELVLDYRWTGWNELDTLGDQFGWENQNIVKTGLTWDATERLTLRGGVSHGNSPIDSNVAFSNALFPAIVETHLTCGVSYAFDACSVNLAYMHAIKETVTANGNDAGGFGAGTKISMYQHSLTLGASWLF